MLCRRVAVGLGKLLHVVIGDARTVRAEELFRQRVIEVLHLREVLEQIQIHVVRPELFVELRLRAAVAHDVPDGLVDGILHELLARGVKRHVVLGGLDLDEVVPGDVVDDALGHEVGIGALAALVIDGAPVRDLHAVALHVRQNGAQEVGILVPVHGAAIDGHDLLIAAVGADGGGVLIGRGIAALLGIAAHAGRGAAAQTADGHHESSRATVLLFISKRFLSYLAHGSCALFPGVCPCGDKRSCLFDDVVAGLEAQNDARLCPRIHLQTALEFRPGIQQRYLLHIKLRQQEFQTAVFL